MDSKEIFAYNLNYFMNENGKSRKDVADAIGVSYFTFTDWVKGKKFPRMDKVEKLAKYFGIKVSDLVEKHNISTNPVETAEFHAKVLMDQEVMKMLEQYYSLNNREQQIVRNFVASLNQETN